MAAVAFGERSEILTEWLDGPGHYEPRHIAKDITGGATDAHMQSRVDAAFMAARRKELSVLESIADAAFAMKVGRAQWQEAEFGRVVGDIRK